VKVVLASSNPHKAEELARSLPGWEIGLLGVELPPETGTSYYENARAKAEFGRGVRAGEWILG
jgi:inosine/xanthosine triphosphate pyrophosphatase family protein